MNDPFLQFPLKQRQVTHSLISRGKSLNTADPYTLMLFFPNSVRVLEIIKFRLTLYRAG